jgi:hypothetical protein
MFPQLKKINNESGIVLFIVLMTAIIIMIFSVGILTESANEVNSAQQQIDQIEADEIAKGIFWNAYSSGSFSAPNITWQGRTYTMSVAPVVINATTNRYTTTVSYDTFN